MSKRAGGLDTLKLLKQRNKEMQKGGFEIKKKPRKKMDPELRQVRVNRNTNWSRTNTLNHQLAVDIAKSIDKKLERYPSSRRVRNHLAKLILELSGLEWGLENVIKSIENENRLKLHMEKEKEMLNHYLSMVSR